MLQMTQNEFSKQCNKWWEVSSCRNSSNVLILLLYGNVITQIWNKKHVNGYMWNSWKFKMTTFHDTFLISFCIVDSKYWVFSFQKANASCYICKFLVRKQEKCYKSIQNLIFFQYFVSFVVTISIGWLNFRKVT